MSTLVFRWLEHVASLKRLASHSLAPCLGKSINPAMAPSVAQTAIVSIATNAYFTKENRPRHSSTPLRIVHVLERGQSRGHVGRMVISGRMADVCAELDRLAAFERA